IRLHHLLGIAMNDERGAALVTGASSGIGQAAAIALARAGHNATINYSSSEDGARETAKACEAAGTEAQIHGCNVSDDAAGRAMVAAHMERFGRLDVLVNNAGISTMTPPSDLEGLDMDVWDDIFAVNVRGLFQVSRAAAPHLKEAQGCIVNSASIVGLRPGPQPFPYAASKAAVVSLTKTLAGALAPEVRVNAVAPGWMEGAWMERMLEDNYEGLMARRARYTPMQACVTAEDVAETIMSLVNANRFVTGEIIIVDGGFASVT
ncbi:MAG: SDR family oxidoreductase, partial [Rhodospirillales bacterium]|nr:SDR family oxidoreductase [Rhodospirillales bacterium]